MYNNAGVSDDIEEYYCDINFVMSFRRGNNEY